MIMPKRELTELEKQFVFDALAGAFIVKYDENGVPFALGASNTDNLFSMPVHQEPEGEDGAIYTLPGKE